jgi:hypothetical protein
MSDAQAQRAIQQLYENTSARDELSDDEANVLLQWGEAQIHSARNLNPHLMRRSTTDRSSRISTATPASGRISRGRIDRAVE